MDNTISQTPTPKKRDQVKDFFNRTPIRALVNAILDLSLAIYTALVQDWKAPLTWIILIGLGIIDLVVIAYYAAQTANTNAIICSMRKDLRYDDNLIAEMDRSCEMTIEQSWKVVKKILNPIGKLSLNDWNFRMACCTAIHKIWKLLTEYYPENYNHFELCYDRVKYKTDLSDDSIEKEFESLETIACYTCETSDPSIKEILRKITLDGYYDAEYIYRGFSEIECLMNNSAVKEKFRGRSKIGGAMPNLDQYNQVFLVPVLHCKRDLVGLLTIACLDKTSLGNDPKMITKFIQRKVGPYLNLLLVFHRLEELFVLKEIKED